MMPVNHFGAPLQFLLLRSIGDQALSSPLVSLFLSLVSLSSHRPFHTTVSLRVAFCLCPRCLLHPPENSENSEMPECTRPARCTSAFIPIQVAAIQYRIYGALTLSRQEGTARLMGWAGWGNNRLFDVTSLIGVDLLTD